MPDATADVESRAGSTLARRLDARLREIPPVTLPANFPASPTLTFPFRQRPATAEVAFAAAFSARMLFSALIDADRAATEAFCE